MQRIPSLRELGFPEKFQEWRPAQLECLQWMLASNKRVKAPCAPTGFGKTLVVVTYAILTKQPTCFVTESRGLQDQYMEDYRGVGMVDLRGRRNYHCDLKPDYTCEDGYATRCPHKGSVRCPSSQAEMRAATSHLVVTNYDKWTAARKFGQGMSHFTQVVFDEGDQAHEALSRAMQVILNYREIEDGLGLSFPMGTEADEFVNWKPWAAKARVLAEAMMMEWRDKIAGVRDAKPSWVRQYLHYRNLSRRLAIVSTAAPNNWVVDEWTNERKEHGGYQFDAVRPGRYGEGMLLLRLPSIVVISATLRPKALYMVGLSKDSFDYREFPSDFDPQRCPIYYVPTMRVDSRAHDLSQLWIKLDQIAARRTDRKGLVQTISFDRQQEVERVSRFRDSMILNPRGEAPKETIDFYRASGPGTILVSPSFGRGYDFPMRDCEWQFICKIPFPDGRSRIMKARQEDDKEYGGYLAMTKLVQIFGRPMRSQADQVENFICDEHLDWFVPRYGHLAPKSFHGFFKRVSVVPPPPPPL